MDMGIFLFLFIITSSNGGKIIGGYEPDPYSIPFIVSLQNKKFDFIHYCGGTIVDKNHVLTSARCCEKVNYDDIRVAVEENYIDTNEHEQFFRVHHMAIHEKYDPATLKHDICILTLKGVVGLNQYAETTKLPEPQHEFVDGDALIAGWGSIGSEEYDPTSNTLKAATIEIQNATKCIEIYGDYFNEDSMMCAGGKEGVGACTGDSGGPMICKSSYQCGIISWSRKCGLKGFPMVSTKIVYYLSWIQANTGD